MQKSDKLLFLSPGDPSRYIPPWYFLEIMMRTICNQACLIAREMNERDHNLGQLVQMQMQRDRLAIALEYVQRKLIKLGRPHEQEYYHKHIATTDNHENPHSTS